MASLVVGNATYRRERRRSSQTAPALETGPASQPTDLGRASRQSLPWRQAGQTWNRLSGWHWHQGLPERAAPSSPKLSSAVGALEPPRSDSTWNSDGGGLGFPQSFPVQDTRTYASWREQGSQGRGTQQSRVKHRSQVPAEQSPAPTREAPGRGERGTSRRNTRRRWLETQGGVRHFGVQ